MIYAGLAVLGLLASAQGKIYFKEDFNDKGWEDRWTISSDWKPKVGTMHLTQSLNLLVLQVYL
jgi:hypothetical protein